MLMLGSEMAGRKEKIQKALSLDSVPLCMTGPQPCMSYIHFEVGHLKSKSSGDTLRRRLVH